MPSNEFASRTGTESLNPSSHFLSRFRLSRATSLGSSRAPLSLSMLNDEEESSLRSIQASDSGFAHGNESQHNSDTGPVARIHTSLGLNTSISHSSDGMQASQTVFSISPAASSPTPMQQERETRDANFPSRRQFLGSETLMSGGTSVSPPVTGYHSSNVSSSLINNQYGVETSRSRDTRYHDLLDDLLERVRRLRSQVHARRRSGGRLEALFQGLEEIHQRLVVLSSRPRVSSIGPVPAPNEPVESLPLKTYTKSLKHQTEDDAQKSL